MTHPANQCGEEARKDWLPVEAMEAAASSSTEPRRKRPRVHCCVPDLERARQCPWFGSAERSLCKQQPVDHRDFAMLIAMAWEGCLVTATEAGCTVLRACHDNTVQTHDCVTDTIYALFPHVPEDRKSMFGNHTFLKRTLRSVFHALRPPRMLL